MELPGLELKLADVNMCTYRLCYCSILRVHLLLLRWLLSHVSGNLYSMAHFRFLLLDALSMRNSQVHQGALRSLCRSLSAKPEKIAFFSTIGTRQYFCTSVLTRCKHTDLCLLGAKFGKSHFCEKVEKIHFAEFCMKMKIFRFFIYIGWNGACVHARRSSHKRLTVNKKFTPGQCAQFTQQSVSATTSLINSARPRKSISAKHARMYSVLYTNYIFFMYRSSSEQKAWQN